MDEQQLCRRCGVRPGKVRYYLPNEFSALAGSQLKFSVKQTVGCDECWAEFRAEIERRRG